MYRKSGGGQKSAAAWYAVRRKRGKTMPSKREMVLFILAGPGNKEYTVIMEKGI